MDGAHTVKIAVFVQLGVALEVVDYSSDALVFSNVLKHGAKNSATASLVMWYAPANSGQSPQLCFLVQVHIFFLPGHARIRFAWRLHP